MKPYSNKLFILRITIYQRLLKYNLAFMNTQSRKARILLRNYYLIFRMMHLMVYEIRLPGMSARDKSLDQ